jgi:nicotinamide phosphoribosyltransferase
MKTLPTVLGTPKNYLAAIPFLIRTDSYKAGHALMYPPDTTEMVAYSEYRKPFTPDDHRIVQWGVRYKLETLLNRRITWRDIEEADEWYATHGVGKTSFFYPRETWIKVINKGGFIPLVIEALPDGTVFYPHVPWLQITATAQWETDGTKIDFQNLCTWFECELMHIWSPSTTATKSARVRELYTRAFERSVDSDAWFLLESRFHDFGYRGVSSTETAMVTGAAHLLFFEGTDTQPAGWLATQMNEGRPVGESVLASEHSVALSWLNRGGETAQVKYLSEHAPEGAILSNIADTTNYWKYLKTVVPATLQGIRDRRQLFVARPDSGDTIECVVRGLQELASTYGATLNSKGYQVIDGAAVIQGDGLELHQIDALLNAVMEAGFSAQCLACGMGGGLLQKQNRDTLSAATKLAEIEYDDGTVYDVIKVPITDSGKNSLPGKKAVVENPDGSISTIFAHERDSRENLLKVIWTPPSVRQVLMVPELINVLIENAGGTFDTMRQRARTQWQARPKIADVISPSMKTKITELTTQFRSEHS